MSTTTPALVTRSTRRALLLASAALGAGLSVPYGLQAQPGSASAQGGVETVLRIAMTAADIPLTAGQPDNGFEGYRFTGYTIYDALVNWDLSSAEKASDIRPGLATEWSPKPDDPTVWTIKLRQGVKFHDGSAFNADAVIWNLEKIFNDKSPQYAPDQSAQVSGRISSLKSYRKVDDGTVEITTKAPDSFFPYQLTYVLYSSPTHWEQVGRDWNKFSQRPSGTGPFRVVNLVPRERLELIPNRDYWEKDRIPRMDKIVLMPVPEASARTAALLSGQVDWIEAPAPDAIPRMQSSGYQIISNPYPHIWSWHLSRLPDSPWNDIRVRKAANLAVDREGMKAMLRGMMQPARGHVLPTSPWFGNPSFELRHDPKEASRLMTEAGYSKQRPLKVTVRISASGSGQMQPLPMNEFMQESLKDVGFDVSFEVMEWESLLSHWRAGAAADVNKGASAVNVSYATIDPFSAFVRFMQTSQIPPGGLNWGHLSDPKLDELMARARATFDTQERDRILAEVHTYAVDQALFLWVAHDVNPRAISPKVKGFVQAQNWFQDLTPVRTE